MNWSLLCAGVLSLGAVVGHLTLGRTQFLRPMLDSSMDRLPKKVFHALFHMITADFVVCALALFALAFGAAPVGSSSVVALIVAALFVGYGTVYLAIASTVSGGMKKMFQWSVFFATAVLAVVGSGSF